MYITAAGTGILVLNSHKAATDLLERRGHIYSDRPRLISELLCYSPSHTLTTLAPQMTSGWRVTHFRPHIAYNKIR